MTFFQPIVLQKYAQNPLNRNLDLNTFKITNVSNGTSGLDAVNLNQLLSIVPSGSSGSLPFALTSGPSTLGLFTNPSGNNIQFTNPTNGRLQFTDVDGIDIINTNVNVNTNIDGDVFKIVKSTNTSGNTLDIDHAGTEMAIHIINRGTGDSFRVDDSFGDTGVFRIDADGSVGCNVSPSIPIGAAFRANFGTSIFTLDTNNDINLGTTTDIYFGIGGGANNRPRMRMTYRNESAGADAGTIYFQYSGQSGTTNNQRFSFTKGASNDATLNILPFSRRVIAGAIDSISTPNATFQVQPPATNSVPSVRISRNTTGTLRNTLICEGSRGNVQINNSGDLGLGFTNDMVNNILYRGIQMYCPTGDVTKIGFTQVNGGVTDPIDYIAYVKQPNSTLIQIQARSSGNNNFGDIIDLAVGANEHEFIFSETSNITIGSATFNDLAVFQTYNGTTGETSSVLLGQDNNGTSHYFNYTQNAQQGLLSENAISFMSNTADVVQVVGGDYIANPNQNRIIFKTNAQTGTNTEIKSKGTSLKVHSETGVGADAPITLEGSVVNLQNNLGNAIKISNVAIPTNATDVANKQYVDSVAGGGGTATAFTLNSNTAGNANGYRIINLTSGINTGDAVRTEVITWNTLFGPISSLVNLPRPILGASPVTKFINSNGAIGINSQNTNNIYYLLSSSASPNSGVQLNTSNLLSFNVAPCVPVPTNPTGFSSVTVWALLFRLTGTYRISFSARVGNLTSGTITSSRFNLSLYQGFYNDLLISNPTPDTIINNGALGYYAGSNNPVSSSGALNNFLTFDYIHLYDSSIPSNCLTFGTISGAGALDWAGASINTSNLVISVEYLGRIYQ